MRLALPSQMERHSAIRGQEEGGKLSPNTLTVSEAGKPTILTATGGKLLPGTPAASSLEASSIDGSTFAPSLRLHHGRCRQRRDCARRFAKGFVFNFKNCQKSNRRKRKPTLFRRFLFGEETLWAMRIRNKRTLPLNFFRTFSAKNAHTASSFSASEKRDPPAFWQLLFSAPSAGEPSVFPYPIFQRAGKSGCFVSPFPFSLIRRKMLRFPPIPSPLHQRENVSLSVYSFPSHQKGSPPSPFFSIF